ncbi:MAG: hypothetical protein AB7O04_00145 [Hyphomonadaceae bacterium]
MLRTIMIAAAVLTASAAALSCASDEEARIRAAQRATCREPASTVENPTYDRECMRRVEEQIQAAKNYRPSSRPPKQKGK